MGVPLGAAPRHLLELTPHNVCVGFLLAIYIREYEASSLDLNTVMNPHHALAVFLMERTAAASGPLPFPAFCAALDAIHPTWSMEFQVAMRRLSARSVHDVAECLVTLCLPQSDDVFVATTPFGRFSRMLALAIHSAFFSGLCSLRDAMQVFLSSSPAPSSIGDVSAASVLDAIDNGLPVDDIHLRRALEADPSSTRLLFARYVNFQRRREFLGALDALHMYHNTAIHVAPDVPSMKRFGPHYASLNLAILHWSFQHPAKAIAALHETIRVAQSARDKVCVAYALSYLLQWDAPFDLQRAFATIEMADAAALPQVSLMASLAAIQHGSPATAQPSVLSLRTWLGLQATGSAATDIMHPPSTMTPDSPWLLVPKHARLNDWVQTQVQISLTQAQTWRQYGFRTMHRLELAKAGALASGSPLADIAVLLCHQVLVDVETLPQSRAAPWTASTVYAPALSAFAHAVLALDAAALPGSVKPSEVVWQDSVVQQSLLRIFVDWALARMELRRAGGYLRLWESLGMRTPAASVDLAMAKARLLRRQDRLDEAQKVLDSIPRQDLPPFDRANVLLQLSHVTLHPDAPFDALPALMECLAVCEEAGSQVLAAHARVLLARLYVAMDRVEDAVALLQETCPYVMEHGAWTLQAQVGLELAKAYFILGDDKCVPTLERSKDAAVHAEDLLRSVEIGMVLARVHHVQQDWNARDRVAAESLAWTQLLESNSERGFTDTESILESPHALLRVLDGRGGTR